jgi:hypothetical protein
MSVVVAQAIPDTLFAEERERRLTMVDILESVSLEAVRALAQCFTFTRLEARDAVLGAPDEHAEGLLLLVKEWARVYEDGNQGGS